MEVKELGHLVLYVRDLKRSVTFYRDVLGWRAILGGGDDPLPFPAAAFSAPSNRTHHELLLIEVGPDAAPLPAPRAMRWPSIRCRSTRPRPNNLPPVMPSCSTMPMPVWPWPAPMPAA